MDDLYIQIRNGRVNEAGPLCMGATREINVMLFGYLCKYPRANEVACSMELRRCWSFAESRHPVLSYLGGMALNRMVGC